MCWNADILRGFDSHSLVAKNRERDRVQRERGFRVQGGLKVRSTVYGLRFEVVCLLVRSFVRL